MSYAASQYQKASGAGMSARDVEIMALTHVNDRLAEAALLPLQHHKRRDALTTNYKLWSILLLGIENRDTALPPILKQDLLTLGKWSLHYSNLALNQNLPLSALTDINRDMIDGLKSSAQPVAPPIPTPATTPQPFAMVG